MADRAIGAYSPETAKMILEVVKYLKSNGFLTQGGLKEPMIADAPRVFLAITTSTITARSGTTAGKGTATLKYIPGVAGTATTISDFPATAATIDVYNIITETVASGEYVGVARECGSGKWFIVVAGCA